MKRLLLIASVLLSLQVCAQQDPHVADTTVYSVVDSMPEYPGGPGAMMTYLSKNINYTNYPASNCVLPKLYIQFVINAKGEVTQPTVSTRQNFDCAELNVFFQSVKNALIAMPTWTPGKLNGHPVNVRLNLPMNICMGH